MNEEMIARASELQQKSEEAEKNLQIINEQMSEMENFKGGLSAFKGAEGKEVLASIGRGVYIKTNIKDTNLFVEVGSGIVLKKKPEEVKNIIAEQLEKFSEAKLQLLKQLESYAKELDVMMRRLQDKDKKV
ncbi:MAG: prefoldin subunit alpha [Nanoarchaeota archaeon]|nr:prefoldin subunit alpha [Nanoarchaeota archaeon]